MSDVTFTNFSINTNSVTLYFEHGSFWKTKHDKTISIEQARSVISSMIASVEKYSTFYLNYDGHRIEVSSSLANRCIQKFQAIHGK